MVGDVRWGGDTVVEGVEHVEDFGEYVGFVVLVPLELNMVLS